MFKKALITSCDSVRLTVSGMRMTEIYEIICKEASARVSRYDVVYENGEEHDRLRQRATAKTEAILALLNQCGVLRWNGFCGNNPPGVRDGIMFRFEASVNDDRNIYASGSNNFPKHYREFFDGLTAILS